MKGGSVPKVPNVPKVPDLGSSKSSMKRKGSSTGSVKKPKDTGYMTLEPPKDTGYMTLAPPKHTDYMPVEGYTKLPEDKGYVEMSKSKNPSYGLVSNPDYLKVYGSLKDTYPNPPVGFGPGKYEIANPKDTGYMQINAAPKPTNTSPTKNSIYKYLTNTGTKSGDYSARLARINPETLSKLNGDDSLKYLKKNFTAVKADEINKFFGEELKGTTTPAEKQAKIKEILTEFTTQASKNNKAKHTVMTNIRTFKNSAASIQRQRRTNRSTNLEKSLSGQLKSAREALTTEPKRKPLKQLSAEKEPNPNRRINPNYSSNPKRFKPEEHIYSEIGELPKTQLEEALANEMKRINPAPPLPPPRRGSNPNNIYEVIAHNKNVRNRLEQMKTVTNLTSPGGLYSE